MCEFLVRVVDKTNPDPYKDVRCTKRGDAIVVVPDGHQWSQLELTNPEWRIISCPPMSLEEGESFLAEEPGDIRVNPMLQKRVFKIDIDNFAKRQDMENPRGNHIVCSPVELRAVKVMKPPIPNPNIIGGGVDFGVIG